ncbi:hypothetical protein [Rubrivirga sp.]|uniref:hypothetical protein n=1 Tax=Rubrivirga sp. TaxID=1885344 RepID=UPI003C71D217
MGKVALLIVLSAGIAGGTILFTSQETDVRSAAVQGEYQADVIAREIARSAFNSASADVHRFGTDIDAAINAFGDPIVSADMPQGEKCANGKATCARRTGSMMDGTYIAEASYDGGNGVDIYAGGTFTYNAGGEDITADHEINESQTVGVLRVSEGGLLRIQFVDSQAGYCSAIFLKRTLPGVAEEDQPLPEMVYAPGKNRNGERNVGLEVELAAGTQMNFAIGVDNRCGGNGTRPNSRPDLRYGGARDLAGIADPDTADPDPYYGWKVLADSMATYQFLESDWAWVHWALDGSTVSLDEPQEGPWAMVETDPSNGQRWRVAFEDIHDWNLAPTHPQYENPNRSLWATKKFGYDWTGSFNRPGNDGVGDGWTDNVRTVLEAVDPDNPRSSYRVYDEPGQDGFHDLRNTGRPADFSDQVIMVEIIPASIAGA